MTTTENNEVLKTIGESYMFLSNVFMRVPEDNFPQVLTDDLLPLLLRLEELAKAEGWTAILDATTLLQKCVESGCEDKSKKLAKEFTRLFRGVRPGYGPKPPYESLYVGEVSVHGEATSDVLHHYQKLGTVPTTDFGNEPPDHIAYELSYLGTVKLLQATDEEGKDYSELRRQFITEHVNKWIPSYCETIIEESTAGFYRGIAKLTGALIQLEIKELGIVPA